MKNNKSHWFGSILLGAALALPPVLFAAEKADMMKDDKGKMMKDDKDAKMKKETKMMKDDMKMESKEKKMK
ncbi:MAG TPA: hypothetical protein VIE90_11710 [Candidatus Binatia bacterium]|jgi:hypothetical protein